MRKRPAWLERVESLVGQSDRALLTLVVKGDPQAAKRLVQRLSPPAHALAWRMLGDSALAQDVVQEAFIKLLHADEFGGQAALTTYFHTIVTRLCLDRLRVPHSSAQLQDKDLQLLEASDEGAFDPQQSYARTQQTHRVQQALMRLGSRQRVALSLWAYQDAPVAEIANTMGLEINAAHQLLHRAKINLRQILGKSNEK